MKRLVGFYVCGVIVFVFSLVAAEHSSRIVTITAVVDSRDRTMAVSTFLHRAFLETSKTFQREFNIKLKLSNLEIGSWHSPSDNFDGNIALVDIAKIPRKSDIVVAFTTKMFYGEGFLEIDGGGVFTQKQFGGLAVVGGNHAIVRLEERTELILIHELGHIFGADHSTDIHSVMNGENILSPIFDKKSLGVICANRNRRFH